MNSTIASNTLRFVFVVLLQVLVFKRFTPSWENFNHIHIFIYPVFILLLPFRTPHALLVFLGFLIGLTIDLFYDSPGVHASACVFVAWIRPAILRVLEPRGGYELSQSPVKKDLGINWFFSYSIIMMLCHLFFYFSVEAFTFVYFIDIFLNTVFSFIASMIFVILYQLLFNPGD